MEVFRIAGIGIFSAILAITVRKWQPELGLAIGIGAGVILIIYSVNMLGSVIYEFENILVRCGIDADYLKLVVKLTGIAYVTKFAGDICRDSGEGAIAEKVEFCGKVMVFALTVPVISDFLKLVIETLGTF